MEEVAGQPCCNRDPATEIILSDGDIDRYLPLGAIQTKVFNYPVTNVLVSGKLKSLKFQETWFDGRPWLEYSVSMDEAGCFYCRLFKPILNGHNGKYEASVLSSKDWKKATGKDGKLFKHEMSQAHGAATESYRTRVSSITNNTSIAAKLSQAYHDKLEKEAKHKHDNRKILECIIDALKFLVRQGLALRGDDESSTSENRGNFIELLNLLAKNNPQLDDWLRNHPGNVSWLSPQIQNELLASMAMEVTIKLSSQCNGKLFSVMCDEVSDRSNKQYMSIVVRYVSDTAEVVENLVGLVEVLSTTADNLLHSLLLKLKSYNLALDYLVGQCYDGASNMSGCYNGLQARLKELAPRAPIYIHCWAHVLNLVLQDVTKSASLCSRTFELLQEIYAVIEGSPQRHGQYLKAIEELHLDVGLLALQSLSGTRWAARCVNLRIVHRCLPAVLACLTQMNEVHTAGLLKSISDPTFVFGLEFLMPLFLAANATSEALQAKDIDLSAAAQNVASLKVRIAKMEDEFDDIFDKTLVRCGVLDIPMSARSAKRTRKVPASLQNCLMDRFLVDSSSAATTLDMLPEQVLKTKLRIDFFRPVMDAMKMAIERRFNADCVQVITHISAVFPASLRQDGIRTLSNMAKLDGDLCVAEALLLATHAQYDHTTSLKDLAQQMVREKHHMAYKNVYQLIIYLLTLPVTSASCERSHSKVDLIKSAVRSSMTSGRLESLITMACEKKILNDIPNSDIVARFAASPRGLPL